MSKSLILLLGLCRHAKPVQIGKGAAACQSALLCLERQGTHVQQVFAHAHDEEPAVVRPIVSYGCEIRATACSLDLALGPERKERWEFRWPPYSSFAIPDLERASHPASPGRWLRGPGLTFGGPFCWTPMKLHAPSVIAA